MGGVVSLGRRSELGLEGVEVPTAIRPLLPPKKIEGEPEPGSSEYPIRINARARGSP